LALKFALLAALLGSACLKDACLHFLFMRFAHIVHAAFARRFWVWYAWLRRSMLSNIEFPFGETELALQLQNNPMHAKRVLGLA